MNMAHMLIHMDSYGFCIPSMIRSEDIVYHRMHLCSSPIKGRVAVGKSNAVLLTL